MVRYWKYPAEQKPISVDFTNDLASGETLVEENCNVYATDKNGDDATSTIISGSVSLSGAILTTKAVAGTALDWYTIIFKGVTDTPNTYIKTVKLHIRGTAIPS
jgi:hypothetical protein